MNTNEIIKKLIIDRTNDLSVKSVEVVKTYGSMGNPCIRVGTLPFYEWDKVKEMTYVITYGRYLNCEMLVYRKQISTDKDYTIIKGQKEATEIIKNILSNILS